MGFDEFNISASTETAEPDSIRSRFWLSTIIKTTIFFILRRNYQFENKLLKINLVKIKNAKTISCVGQNPVEFDRNGYIIIYRFKMLRKPFWFVSY